MTTSTLLEILVQYAQSLDSNQIFFTTLTKNTVTKIAPLAPNAVQLLNHQDPFSNIVEKVSKDLLTSAFLDQNTLLNGLPHLYSLKGFPVVINVDLEIQDYTIIPALKDLSIPIFVSNDLESAVANARKVTELVAQTCEPVIHFFNLAKIEGTASQPQAIENFAIAEEPVSAQDVVLENFRFYSNANSSDPTVLLVNLSPYAKDFVQYLPNDAALLDINVYRPWNVEALLENIPSSVRKIAIVQSANQASQCNGFEPLLLDFFVDFNKLVERNIDQLIISNVGTLDNIKKSLQIIIDNVKQSKPNTTLFLGKPTTDEEAAIKFSSSVQSVLNLENSYLKVLKQVFSSNLQILNEYSSETVQANSPEYGFGLFLNQEKNRKELINLAKKSLDTSLFNFDEAGKLVQLLSKWISFNEQALAEESLIEANTTGNEIFNYLQNNQHSTAALELLKLAPSADAFSFQSNWLVGSDAWSFDVGNSGIHQVLSSKRNLNVLLIDSEPHEDRKVSTQRKKDIGLYAMNFRDVYVASVAVYASYTQLLTSIIEAAKFNGPSIVLAYLPYHSETDTPLEVLKETKNAVESGYWPLYRYNPSKEKEEEVFYLDSSVIRKELQSFLDRENKLTLLTKGNPQLTRNLEQSASDHITRVQEKRAKAAFDQLLAGLSGPPLHIYYASDGGNATSLANKLGARAVARGLKSTVLSMDDIIMEDLAEEENVVFITATAGQGEFPQDGKSFWDQIKASTDLDLAALNFSVFGLGDSQYWPRKEDKHYYNKPAKDLFKRLELLTAKPIVPLGLGDDQDADGFQTGYSEWEAQIWEALGVSGAVVPDEPKDLTNEDMKAASDFLRGTIVEGFADESTGAISATDQQLTKFHGFYMQDERDIRETRKAQGLEPYYSFMIRVRLPGGKITPEQWKVLTRLADENGFGNLKITTRATIQLHGIVKGDVKHALRAMNSTLMDTVAACGDVNRNVTVSALPANAKVHEQVSTMAAHISNYFLPKTTAYYEIWLQGHDKRDEDPSWPSIFENRGVGPVKEKTLVAGNALVDVEPIYSPVYLPRKFKVNIAVPPYNDVDVFSSDVGLVAIVDEPTQIVKGYNLYVGGGMGTTHNNKKTYPRTGSSFGYVKSEDVIEAVKAVMVIQRDNGDRKNRKHARLKYTIDDMGVEVYKQKTEELIGKKFEPEQPYEIKSNIDYFGWVKDEKGLNHFTAFIQNGRVADTVDLPQKTGLLKVADLLQKHNSGHFRVTGNQHALISDIKDEHLDEVKKVLKDYKLDNTSFSGLRTSSAACVALPTCGLAMAESERYLPVLITKIEDILEEYGLRHDSIVMRMTGCPNGCSRPWLAEIALIGKAPGTYNLMLGGGYHGQRLNKLYRASIKEEEILSILKPLFKRWALDREDGEHFGDFLIRSGVINPTLEGKYFHDDIPEEAL